MPAVAETTDLGAELQRKHIDSLLSQPDFGSQPLPPAEPRTPPRFRQWMAWAAPIASLLATAWVVWFASLVPRLDRLPPALLLKEAVEYALLAWAWAGALTLGQYLLIPRPPGFDVIQFTLRTSATAVWFAPAMLSLSASSLGSIAAGLVLVASTTRLLYFHWRLIYGTREAAPAWMPPREFLEPPRLQPLPRQLLPSLVISFTLETGLLYILMGRSLFAAVLLGTGMALLTLFATLSGAWPNRPPAGLLRSILSVLLTVALGSTLTMVGLSRRLIINPEARWDVHFAPRPDFFTTLRNLLDAILYGPKPPGGPQAADSDEPEEPAYTPPQPGGGDFSDGDFPGVVIWPEVKPQTILVAPLPALGPSLFSRSDQVPLSIPFAGEYWLFKPPQARPPAGSLMRRGTPVDLGFFTTDHRAMFMEARHRLEQPIEVRCCSHIRLEISNADRYPGTVSLELILVNTRAKGRPWMSLGNAAVLSRPAHSAPPWLPGKTLAAPEALDFPIPRGRLREFDEFRIIFHRDRLRADRSAKMAIERIVFVPRSM